MMTSVHNVHNLIEVALKGIFLENDFWIPPLSILYMGLTESVLT